MAIPFSPGVPSSISPARAAAFDMLLRIEREESFASELLHSASYQKMSSPDHGLATELVMGVLRWQSLLDSRIAAAVDRSLQKLDLEVLIALRLGAYQLSFLDRIPASAAVNESVQLVKRAHKRSAIPFANAVLRRLSSKLDPGSSESSALAPSLAQPPWLLQRWTKQFGESITSKICEYNQRPPDVTIRMTASPVEEELKRDGVRVSPGKLLTSAYRVLSGTITKTASFRHGEVTIQDEASQLVAMLMGRGPMILDCCAAPGGKTRILADLNPSALIVAMDLHPHRARLLRRLVPARNVHVIAADVRHLPTNIFFDRVLVDVPCSGTGTLARNPEIKWRLQPSDLVDLQSRQIAILRSAMSRVAPGGRLVYPTCSLEPEENTAVIEAALAGEGSFRIMDCQQLLDELQSEGQLAWNDLGSLTDGPYFRTIPGVHPTDGFFAAVLQRQD